MLDEDDLYGVNLKGKFSFYYRINEEGLSRDMKPNEFADQVKLIKGFSTIEQFWEIFQHIRKPDQCKKPGTELFLFAEEIKPLWEDPINTNGGKVSIRLKKDFSSIIWEEIILAFIGNIFPIQVHQEITGLVISMRKECNVLQVWFRNYNNEKASLIEQAVKELLLVPEGVEVETKPFFKNYFGVPNYSLVINEEKCKTNLIDDKIHDLKSNDVIELNIGKKIDINEILPHKSEKKVDTSKKEKDNNNIDSIEYEYEYNYDYDYNSNSNNNYYKGQTNANTTQNSKRYNNRSSKSGYYPKYDTKYSNKNEYNYEEDYYNTTKTNDYDYYNYNTGGKGKKKYK